MSDLLLAMLERLPSRARRLVVASGALLALAGVMVALTLNAPQRHRQRQPVQAPVSRPVERTSPQRLAPPVRPAAIARARRVAERFLAGYLPFAYGRGGAVAISGISSALRQELLDKRAELTPVERRRHPRVVSLQMTATTPTFVVATAVIEDGGVTSYRLRFTLEGRAGRWLVSGVQEG